MCQGSVVWDKKKYKSIRLHYKIMWDVKTKQMWIRYHYQEGFKHMSTYLNTRLINNNNKKKK